jgi:pyruvate formate-lyase activating enzyme-like uncharacterized protein
MTEDTRVEAAVTGVNQAFREYAGIYEEINRDFLEQVSLSGLELEAEDESPEAIQKKHRLADAGALIRNEGKSVYANRISPACLACREGVGSATFFVSLRCNRDCYFCFNPNQEHYTYYREHQRDLIVELDKIKDSGEKVSHLALTGGEPLLHPEESLAFFEHARSTFPDSHTRLYTSGDLITPELLERLKQAGLDEIRFSIRLHDSEHGRQTTLRRIAVARDFIRDVMVEMPVVPGELGTMRDLLVELDELGIFGINLLEFCFPFRNADVYRRKGYRIKNPPYQVPYNYWYAGGLPIAGSERDCLELVEFALQRKLKMGVHYCSLENKHTGQIYQQNHGRKLSPRHYFSERDFFIKSAKVFGEDRAKVLRKFRDDGGAAYFVDTELDLLEFHVSQIPKLAGLDVTVAICSHIWEQRPGGDVLRELRVEQVRPEMFDRALEGI